MGSRWFPTRGARRSAVSEPPRESTAPGRRSSCLRRMLDLWRRWKSRDSTAICHLRRSISLDLVSDRMAVFLKDFLFLSLALALSDRVEDQLRGSDPSQELSYRCRSLCVLESGSSRTPR